MLSAQAHARAVVQPGPAAFWVFVWDFQPLLSPDPLHPLGVHGPAGMAQQGCDPPVAVASVGLSQGDHIPGQGRFVVTAPGGLALGRAVLSEHRARAALRHLQLRPHLVDAGPATGGA